MKENVGCTGLFWFALFVVAILGLLVLVPSAEGQGQGQVIEVDEATVVIGSADLFVRRVGSLSFGQPPLGGESDEVVFEIELEAVCEGDDCPQSVLPPAPVVREFWDWYEKLFAENEKFVRKLGFYRPQEPGDFGPHFLAEAITTLAARKGKEITLAEALTISRNFGVKWTFRKRAKILIVVRKRGGAVQEPGCEVRLNSVFFDGRPGGAVEEMRRFFGQPFIDWENKWCELPQGGSRDRR